MWLAYFMIIIPILELRNENEVSISATVSGNLFISKRMAIAKYGVLADMGTFEKLIWQAESMGNPKQ